VFRAPYRLARLIIDLLVLRGAFGSSLLIGPDTVSARSISLAAMRAVPEILASWRIILVSIGSR
jgi:hypothetical protein